MQQFHLRFLLCLVFSAFVSPLFAGEKGTTKVPAVLNFKMKDIDGKEVDLVKYQGKVVLIVNVASECGYTPQYKQLQSLHEKSAKDGLVILGIPCNDFGGQEPGSNEKIKQFCTSKYQVTFDMLAKMKVLGDDAAPLYKFLQSKETNPKHAGAVAWNFEKFLIGRDGTVVARFRSDVDPDSEQFLAKIKAALQSQ